MAKLGCPTHGSIKIQPMWTMDEYAISVRSFGWFIPINPPKRAVRGANNRSNGESININDTIARGANFCHVDNNRQFIQESPDITCGNHGWNGTAPILIISLIIKSDDMMIVIIEKYHMVIENINIILEPRAWIKKYLIDDSVSWFDWDIIINGIKDIMLISKANHINSQFVLLMAIKDLIIKVDVIRREKGNVVIRVWKSWTSYIKLEAYICSDYPILI